MSLPRLIAAIGSSGAIANPYAGKNLHVFSDSIGAGVYSTPDNTNGWPPRLSALLGTTLVNHAIPGNTMMKRSPVSPFPGTTNGVDSIPAIQAINPTTLGLLIFALGMNDFGFNYPAYTVENFITDYTTVMDATLAHGISPSQILILSPSYVTDAAFTFFPNISTVPPGIVAPDRPRMLSFVSATGQIAATDQTKYINMYTTLQNSGLTSNINIDGVHWNDILHQFAAQTIYDYLIN